MSPQSPNFERDIYTVSRLNSEVRSVLEGSFPLVWISGEISNLAQPRSGHIYFSLKDTHAQVRCAMFRMKRQLLRFLPENGLQVLVRAKVGLYEGRGEFQLVIEHMEPAGEGALQQAFEMLKRKLSAEGLFDVGKKKPLPSYPRQIGVITSPSGAAVRDILSVLKRRFPSIPVIIYPSLVQGDGAAEQIRKMLSLANQRQDCDILILARGGGSLEDLHAFNDEALAREIYASAIPVVSGVGHEVDFTIADFVADQRAATPSAAAELVVPNRDDIQAQFEDRVIRLKLALKRRLHQLSDNLNSHVKHLGLLHPKAKMQQQFQRIDDFEQRLQRASQNLIDQKAAQLDALSRRGRRAFPGHRLDSSRVKLSVFQQRLHRSIKVDLNGKAQRLGRAMAALDAVSPLATLSRGYAIASRLDDDALLLSASSVQPSDKIAVRLADGRLICHVDSTE